MSTYDLEPLLTVEERLDRFNKASRADDLRTAAFVMQYFPEVYDRAIAYADQMRLSAASEKRAAA